MKKTKIIGLTGGIGSGKSTIADYFQSEGIPVYYADEEAKKLMQKDYVVAAIAENLGNDLVVNKGIDRQKLAKLVFENPNKLKVLNSIIHPLVKKHFETWIIKHSYFPFIIKEAAILFETGSDKQCDKIINVMVPVEERIERVIKRDHVTREEVLSRISKQWTDEERMQKSDFNITNVNKSDALLQAQEILKKLKNL